MAKTLKYVVNDITCSSCSEIIQSMLSGVDSPKIYSIAVNVINKEVTISVDDDAPEDVVETTVRETLGLVDFKNIVGCDDSITDDENNHVGATLPAPANSKRKKNSRWRTLFPIFQGLLGLSVGLAVMILMMVGLSIPPYGLFIIAGVTTALTLFLGADIYYKALKKLIFARRLTMEALFTVSTLVVVGVSIAALFVPWLPMIFDGALMILGFRKIGEAIQNSAKQRFDKNLGFRNRILPRVRILSIHEGGEEQVQDILIEQLKPGDIILVKSGDYIPVDAEYYCDDKPGLISDTMITGSTLPREIKPGMEVKAGSKVAQAEFLRLKVLKSVANSHISKLDNKLNSAHEVRAPIEEITSKILSYGFVPAVFAISIGFGVVTGLLLSPSLAIYSAVSILVSACPCVLGFIIPLAVKVGITKALENGVQFKNGKELQNAANIDTVVFDLNGTLTTGLYRVKKCVSFDDTLSELELLNYFQALEQSSQHPIAKAITDHCIQRKQQCNMDPAIPSVSHLDTRYHSGVKGVINGRNIVVGNLSMMQRSGVDITGIYSMLKMHKCDHVIFIARDKKIVGYMNVEDPLRDDAIPMIQALKRMGKQVHICTGTNNETAQRYAKKCGIDPMHVQADTIAIEDPENPHALTKSHYIARLQQQKRKVAMVGDGGNDAIAMKQCDLGIAVESASTDEVTRENAGVVIRDASLQPIVSAFAIAKQTKSNIMQNLVVSLLYNTAAIVISGAVFVGLGIMPPLAIGVGLMVVQAFLILAWAYRFKKQSIPKLTPTTTATTHNATGIDYDEHPSKRPSPFQHWRDTKFAKKASGAARQFFKPETEAKSEVEQQPLMVDYLNNTEFTIPSSAC